MEILSHPSKMPCPSFSLPAWDTCPGAKKTNSEICGSCYARKGFYRFHFDAQAERLEWVKQGLEDGAFVAAMVEEIRASKSTYFRIHDSGDFFSIRYLEAWITICRLLPEVTFWVPTRNHVLGKVWLAKLRELNRLPNVTVRPSALSFDEPTPMVEGLAAGSTAVSDGASCPAYKQKNQCGDCRLCWDRPDVPVSYRKH